ncbi:hypothetical protein MT418_005229 [Batrachochytrium dendrobatidis]
MDHFESQTRVNSPSQHQKHMRFSTKNNTVKKIKYMDCINTFKSIQDETCLVRHAYPQHHLPLTLKSIHATHVFSKMGSDYSLTCMPKWDDSLRHTNILKPVGTHPARSVTDNQVASCRTIKTIAPQIHSSMDNQVQKKHVHFLKTNLYPSTELCESGTEVLPPIRKHKARMDGYHPCGKETLALDHARSRKNGSTTIYIQHTKDHLLYDSQADLKQVNSSMDSISTTTTQSVQSRTLESHGTRSQLKTLQPRRISVFSTLIKGNTGTLYSIPDIKRSEYTGESSNLMKTLVAGSKASLSTVMSITMLMKERNTEMDLKYKHNVPTSITLPKKRQVCTFDAVPEDNCSVDVSSSSFTSDRVSTYSNESTQDTLLNHTQSSGDDQFDAPTIAVTKGSTSSIEVDPLNPTVHNNHIDLTQKPPLVPASSNNEPHNDSFLDIGTLIRQAIKVQTPMTSISRKPRFDGMHVPNITVQPNRRWQFAIRTVLKLLRGVEHNSTLTDLSNGGLQKIDNAPGVNERSLMHVLKAFQYQGDLVLTTKIQQFLSQSCVWQGSETEENVAMLNRLLMTRISSFSKFPYDQRIRFCSVMTYEAHRRGATIIQQGHEPCYFYFILSGQVEVLKDRSDGVTGKLRLNLLNQGDCFGEVALDGSYQERRTTSIVCTAPSEFLRIDKDAYRKILIGEDSQSDLSKRLKLLKEIPVFSHVDDQILEQAVLKSQVHHFERNTIILEEGKSNRRLFFISSGSCRLDKHLPLIRKRIGKSQWQLRRPEVDTDTRIGAGQLNPSFTLAKGEQYYLQCVSLAEVGPGQSFPEPLPTHISVTESATTERLDLISKINDHDALSMNRAYVTVTATRPVVCITMERIDFARIMTWSMLKCLLDASILYSIPVMAMQDQWILQQGWKDYKRRVVQETILQKSREKWVKRIELQQWHNLRIPSTQCYHH